MNQADIIIGIWEKLTVLIESGQIANPDLLKTLKQDQQKYATVFIDLTENDTELLQEIGFP